MDFLGRHTSGELRVCFFLGEKEEVALGAGGQGGVASGVWFLLSREFLTWAGERMALELTWVCVVFGADS